MTAPAISHHAAQGIAWERLWRLLLAEESSVPEPPAPADSAAVLDSKEVIQPSHAHTHDKHTHDKRKAPASTGAREIRPDRDSRKALTHA